MKSKFLKILLFLAIIFIPLGAAQALDTKTGDSIYIAKEEIVSGNLYAAGNTITIDGTVSGDLIALAQTINVNGRIEGDLIAIGQNISVNGELGGNVRIAGNSLNLNGTVVRNVNLLGSSLLIGKDARVGWDVYALGANLETRGTIDGSLSGQVSQALLAGKIGKNVNLKFSSSGLNQKLIVAPETIINGDLSYSSKNAANISPQASISGQVKQEVPQNKQENQISAWIWSKLFAIFSAIVVGLILVFLLKNLTPKILEEIQEKSFKTLVPGLIIMLVLPPVALLLCFTLIGLPLALIILAWWLIASYLSLILVAILAGDWLIKKIFKKEAGHLFWSLALGVFICWLLFSIPFAGWILKLVAAWIGLGGIYFYATNQLKHL